jgi:hypothetical protein
LFTGWLFARGLFVAGLFAGAEGAAGQEGQRPRHRQQARQRRDVPALGEAGCVELGQQGQIEGPGGSDRDG